MIREPEEITITKDQEELFIQNIIDAEFFLMLVAHIDGKHVGNCSLMSIAPHKSNTVIDAMLQLHYTKSIADAA